MTKKKGCREPNNQTPDSMSENNPRYLVSKDPSWHESNANYVTANLAKKITVRQSQNEIILMAIQGMRQDQNEKLDIVVQKLDILIEEHSSTRKVLNLVNANLAEIRDIIKDKRIQSRESGL
ncbi:MAG: hypothetical protein CV087_24390 [Candidatus Brocadia sp. WS118]|nr:MAG: hypothetical protein CV087_24390 [Candidatus Brocadia sp. WS118]